MSRKEARVAPFPTPAISGTAAQLGCILGVNEQGLLFVEIGKARCLARLAMALDADRLQHAIGQKQPAVMVFENGDETRPIVVGLIEMALPVTQVETGPDRELDAQQAREQEPAIEADVDGRRVRLTAKDEIVLECGQASITMRRNGRVVIRGTHVESYSDGTNRIKGGQVRIN